MTFVIEFGPWLLPFSFTIVAFVLAYLFTRKIKRSGPDPYGAGALIEFATYCVAIIFSSAAWITCLVWLVVTK